MTSRVADPPDAVVRWADPASHGEDGVADVYLPEISGTYTSAGLVVALHGGFWRHEHDRRHLRPLAVALRDLGRVVAVPEYRRSGGRGGWPATFADVRALRSRLPALLAGLWGGRPAGGVADGPVTLLGHSAGGHLALWWALDAAAETTAGAGPPEPPTRVVALAPIADLARAYADDLDDGAVAALLGGGPDTRPEAYAVADVAARLRAGERPECPLAVLHGTDDVQVPPAHSAGLTGVELRLLTGVEHFGLIDPRGRAWPEVVAALGGPAPGAVSTLGR